MIRRHFSSRHLIVSETFSPESILCSILVLSSCPIREGEGLGKRLATRSCKKQIATKMASRNKINDLCNEEGNRQQVARMMGTNENRKELVPWSAKTKTKTGIWKHYINVEKIAEFLKEFEIYKLSILDISEMRWTGSEIMCSNGKTIL